MFRKEGPKKGEGREKRPKVERKNEYDFNADLIDVNTVIPPLPKKGELIPKPDIKQYKEKEKVNSQKIEDIINKKVSLELGRNKYELKNSNSTERHRATASMLICRANLMNFSS